MLLRWIFVPTSCVYFRWLELWRRKTNERIVSRIRVPCCNRTALASPFRVLLQLVHVAPNQSTADHGTHFSDHYYLLENSYLFIYLIAGNG